MAKKELTKRQLQAIETKNKIYNIAINLMDKKGFNNITVEEICKKAGVSVGTFYLYFKSKNNIFDEIYKRADDLFQNHVKSALQEENSLDRIVEYFKHYGQLNVDTGLETMQQLYTTQNKLFTKKGRYMQTLLQEIIKEGQEKKEISTTMTPEEITDFLFIANRGLVYDWCLHKGKYDLEEALVKFTKRLILLLKP
jgi:TetR/AcrR family fatty acid metabolism transcriptional regulator